MNTIRSGALDGQTILITGASRGIGSAVAIACAGAGATTLIAGRDVPALEQVADLAIRAGGAEPVLLPLNLERATADDYADVCELIVDQFGSLDGLILNAAMVGEISPLAHLDGAQWARVFQVNLHSKFLLLRACDAALKQADGATVIFTLAGSHSAGKANWGAFGVSQRAAEGLFELYAAENGARTNVSVVGLVPPAVNTELRRQIFPAGNEAETEMVEPVADHFVDCLLPARRLDLHGSIVDLS